MYTNDHTTSSGTFETFPSPHQIVETDQGLALYMNATWKLVAPTKAPSQETPTAVITWWRGKDGITHSTFPIIRVITGTRVFMAGGWTRKDRIEVQGELIGIIKVSVQCGSKQRSPIRSSTTICLANSAEISEWSPSWCFDEHQRVRTQRTEAIECC